MKTKFLIGIATLFISLSCWCQDTNSEEVFLWPSSSITNDSKEKIRIYEGTGDHVVSNIHNPSITPFLPENATGAAIIIAPGGGHRELWIDHEGYNIAKWFQGQGVTAFVVKYRLANEENSEYTVDEHSTGDMLRAVQLVRSRAEEWSIDPTKIGVMGFSAGGEIAALADMRIVNKEANKSIINSKPNFHALIYPGRSERIMPNKESSPVFIVAGFHDRDDISKGMGHLYLKYKELEILSELHIYAQAGHGFGLRKTNEGGYSKWMFQMYEWLKDIGML